MDKVVRTFIDPDRPHRIYYPGQPYPEPGYAPEAARLRQLRADGLVQPEPATVTPNETAKPKGKKK